jgi:hypothetical protein
MVDTDNAMATTNLNARIIVAEQSSAGLSAATRYHAAATDRRSVSLSGSRDIYRPERNWNVQFLE